MRNRFLLACCLTAFLLCLTAGAKRLADFRPADQLAQSLETIPRRLAGWELASEREIPAAALSRLTPTAYRAGLYRKGDEQLDLLVTYYSQQRAGETMHSPKACLPGAGWEIWKRETVVVPAEPGTVEINKYSVQKAGERMLVFYWYQTRNRVIASEYSGKWLLVSDGLLRGRTSGSMVRLTLPDRPGATEDAVRLTSALLPEVGRCLGPS